jgi:hypothetical protein
MTATDAPRCSRCQWFGDTTPAVSRSAKTDWFRCAEHSWPGDVPLAGAVEQVRERVWNDLDEPQGADDV